jgi:hypothetical protein
MNKFFQFSVFEPGCLTVNDKDFFHFSMKQAFVKYALAHHSSSSGNNNPDTHNRILLKLVNFGMCRKSKPQAASFKLQVGTRFI